ncbi:MAG: hypothetical protein Q7S16_00515 [bacterium]|nr:hypothetical protein [bacterium]
MERSMICVAELSHTTIAEVAIRPFLSKRLRIGMRTLPRGVADA